MSFSLFRRLSFLFSLEWWGFPSDSSTLLPYTHTHAAGYAMDPSWGDDGGLPTYHISGQRNGRDLDGGMEISDDGFCCARACGRLHACTRHASDHDSRRRGRRRSSSPYKRGADTVNTQPIFTTNHRNLSTSAVCSLCTEIRNPIVHSWWDYDIRLPAKTVQVQVHCCECFEQSKSRE